MFRFVLDVSMIIQFLKHLYYFITIKVEKLISMDQGLSGFHKFVIIYILGAVVLQFMGAFTRSFFGPLILVKQS